MKFPLNNFKGLSRNSIAQRGNILEDYRFLGGYLCLLDGTEIFHSEDVHCKTCCVKEHKGGRVTYHHQILGAAIAKPGKSQVIPLCREPITKQDGSCKNDGERNAFQRFLKDLHREHPHLKLTISYDALATTAPHIQERKSFGYDFIIIVKSAGNRTLY